MQGYNVLDLMNFVRSQGYKMDFSFSSLVYLVEGKYMHLKFALKWNYAFLASLWHLLYIYPVDDWMFQWCRHLPFAYSSFIFSHHSRHLSFLLSNEAWALPVEPKYNFQYKRVITLSDSAVHVCLSLKDGNGS